jgi:hypothetical protein
MVSALEIRRNQGGQNVLVKKVLGSTMAKLRQPQFVMRLAESMRDDFVMTAKGPVPVTIFSVPGEELLECAKDIVRGLLTHLYPGFDYFKDVFVAVDVHTATISNPKWDGQRQLNIIRYMMTRTQREIRGSHDEFAFWRQVEPDTHRGAWFLLFYGAMGFFVWHHKPGAEPHQASGHELAGHVNRTP